MITHSHLIIPVTESITEEKYSNIFLEKRLDFSNKVYYY